MLEAAGKLWELKEKNGYGIVREALAATTGLNVPDFSSKWNIIEFLSKWCGQASVTTEEFDNIFALIEANKDLI